MKKRVSVTALLKQYMMLLVLVVIVLLGYLLTNGVLLKPMNVSNLINQNAYIVILAVGMLICILTGGNIDLSVGSVVALVGAESKAYPAGSFGGGNLMLGNIAVDIQRLYVVGITIVMMIVLQFIVKRTKIGKAMRAVSSDADAAQLMGISVDRTISFTFLLGSGLAAVAGVMMGAMFTINPLMGMQPGLKAFIAAVFGGIGSIPGAMIGGVLLGVIETVVTASGASAYKDLAAFVILILVLLIRPCGILGKNVREKV